jgi:hypothetical protein
MLKIGQKVILTGCWNGTFLEDSLLDPGWDDEMYPLIGKTGIVKELYENNRARVRFGPKDMWWVPFAFLRLLSVCKYRESK